MRLEEHFESSSTLQRNERVKLAASFWNNVGAGMVIGGMAGAFFLTVPRSSRSNSLRTSPARQAAVGGRTLGILQ